MIPSWLRTRISARTGLDVSGVRQALDKMLMGSPGAFNDNEKEYLARYQEAVAQYRQREAGLSPEHLKVLSPHEYLSRAVNGDDMRFFTTKENVIIPSEFTYYTLAGFRQQYSRLMVDDVLTGMPDSLDFLPFATVKYARLSKKMRRLDLVSLGDVRCESSGALESISDRTRVAGTLSLWGCAMLKEVRLNCGGPADLSRSGIETIDSRSSIGTGKNGLSLDLVRCEKLLKLDVAVPGSVILDRSGVRILGENFSCGVDGSGVSISAQDCGPIKAYCPPPKGRIIGNITFETPPHSLDF